MRPLRHLDLFSGIGGFALGLQMCGGFDTVGFCESDAHCGQVLAKNFPEIPIHGDIRSIDTDRIGPVDIITGGFPCQPISVAGARLGDKDDRYLWPEMRRVIEAVRPTWVVGENVAGINSMVKSRGPSVVESRTGGRDANGADYEAVSLQSEHMLFVDILDDLDRLDFSVQAFIVPACAVDARHRRDRAWIIARRRDPIGAAPSRRPGRGHPVDRGGPPMADSDRSREQQRQGGVGEVGGRPSDDSTPLADAHCGRADVRQPVTSCDVSERNTPAEIQERSDVKSGPNSASSPLANPEVFGRGEGRPGGSESVGPRQPGSSLQTGSDTKEPGLSDRVAAGTSEGQAEKNRGMAFSGSERHHRAGGEPQSGMGRVADGLSPGLDQGLGPATLWPDEPDVPRVVHDLPGRVDRIKGLGNAVVPQLVAVLAKAILDVHWSAR